MNLSDRTRTETTIKDVENTKAFKEINPLRQKIIIRWKNIKEIDHHLKVIKSKGLDVWNKSVSTEDINTKIVIELYNKKTIKK